MYTTAVKVRKTLQRCFGLVKSPVTLILARRHMQELQVHHYLPLFSLQVTQLYVPSARHVWRTRRMGRIGPLQSTLDGTAISAVRCFFPLIKRWASN